MPTDTLYPGERRKYLRLRSVFPVEWEVVDQDRRSPISDLYEGFTRNVGRGGICIETNVVKGKELPIAAGKSKLKLVINIPLDVEPIEAFATVKWIKINKGALVDTYLFGVSFDFINDIDYSRVYKYALWLKRKPWLLLAAAVALIASIIVSIFALLGARKSKSELERQLVASTIESRSLKKKIEQRADSKKDLEVSLAKAVKAKDLAQEELLETKEDLLEIEEAIERAVEEKDILLESLGELEELEDEIVEPEDLKPEVIVEGPTAVSPERLELEEANYNKLRELILQDKVYSLSMYLSSHQSSIYHVAGLFALAELQYKLREPTIAEANYRKLITTYPDSKYSAYASHRLEQLKKNLNYESQSLRGIYEQYGLPELIDYREIEPYVKK